MSLEVIVPRRLYRQIAGQLRQLIDEGEYPVGSRLPTERELAERLGVSRPTVREALIALEVEGRLKIKVGSGIYVIDHRTTAAAPPPEPIGGPFELLNARAFVESALAEEAAKVAGADDVARLDAVLAEAEAMPPTWEAWIVIDRRFHAGVAAILGNAVLTRCVSDLFDQRINPYFEQLARHLENTSTWRAAHAEHRTVRDAIAAHDPARARAAMREHLELSHARFCRDFGEVAESSSQDGRRTGRPAPPLGNALSPPRSTKRRARSPVK